MSETPETATVEADAGFTVAFLPGVTPGKWGKVWSERNRRQPLLLLPSSLEESWAALREGAAQMALLRFAAGEELPTTEGFHAIELYQERPFAVLPVDHALEKKSSVTLAALRGAAAEAGQTLLEGQDAATVELVAANVGVAVMPQSLARLHRRKDVVAIPVSDAPVTRVALVWPAAAESEWTEEFIGIVRGRTAQSSRGTGDETEVSAKARPTDKAKAAAKAAKEARAARGGGPAGKGGRSGGRASGPAVRAGGRPRRGGR